MIEKIEQPWSEPVAVEDIPESGQHFDLEAPEAAREAIAGLGSLRALPRLSAQFDITPQGAGVHVAGRVTARVGQTCVVTLEPIESDIVETIDLLFAPPIGPQKAKGKGGSRPARSANDGPDPLIGGVVDLGAIATEFLLLGVDPYPRKEGANFSGLESNEPASNPFAALETLKKRSGDGQS
jgi:hypothetical protein